MKLRAAGRGYPFFVLFVGVERSSATLTNDDRIMAAQRVHSIIAAALGWITIMAHLAGTGNFHT